MSEYVFNLFDSSGFPARWYCGVGWRQSPHLGWLHIISDLVTWFSYTLIPIVLVYFMWRRRDVSYPALFWLFAAFIFSCGTVHLIEAVIFWYPIYRVAAYAKLITAVVSATTVIALIRVAPAALSLPSLLSVNRELESANAELERFAYIAAHDLRSPLRGIGQLANWIDQEDGATLSEESRENLSMMHQRLERMEQMLNDLLAYARVGQLNSEIEEISTVEMLQRIHDTLNLPSGFVLKLPSTGPVIKAHRVPLEHVLMNLISNAVKHHNRPELGRIVIRVEDRGDEVVFHVSDNGPGIAPEFQERIFAVFQTLRSRDQVEGSGMGLAIVNKTVREIGGRIELASEVGKGSTFTVYWPVGSEEPISEEDKETGPYQK